MRKNTPLKSGLRKLTVSTAVLSSLFTAAAKANPQHNTDNRLLTAANLCMPGTLTTHAYDKETKTYQHTSASFFFIIPIAPAKDEMVPNSDTFAFETCVLDKYIAKKITGSKWLKDVRHVDLAIFASDFVKAKRNLSQGDIKASIQQLLNGGYFRPDFEPVHAVSTTFFRTQDKAETSFLTSPYAVPGPNGKAILHVDQTPPQNIVPEDPRVKIANLILTHLIQQKNQHEQEMAQFREAAYEFYTDHVMNTASVASVPAPFEQPYIYTSIEQLAAYVSAQQPAMALNAPAMPKVAAKPAAVASVAPHASALHTIDSVVPAAPKVAVKPVAAVPAAPAPKTSALRSMFSKIMTALTTRIKPVAAPQVTAVSAIASTTPAHALLKKSASATKNNPVETTLNQAIFAPNTVYTVQDPMPVTPPVGHFTPPADDPRLALQ